MHNHRAPRVCIIYFSLSGQSRGLINLLAAGLRSQGVEVFIEQIVARNRIGFPFYSVFKTLIMMLLTFFRKRNPIQPLSEECFQAYDLIVLAGPTWSYNPSGPVLDLLDRYGERLFKGRQVIPLISCRGYYRMHERGLKKSLQRCGAQVTDSIIFRHPVPEPWSTIGVFLRSAGYHPEKISLLAKHYNHFGHSVDQLLEVKFTGSRLGAQLQKQAVALEN
ncbi:MAG: flavodoxin family protein [Desulforhopalus sp.]